VTNRLKELALHSLARHPSPLGHGRLRHRLSKRKPNETFTYRLPVVRSGTYWYHRHSRFQEQTRMVGAIIIEPRDKDSINFDESM
jgi:FtsP/CotA-like multicopper oxidase with cupredoxin domain